MGISQVQVPSEVSDGLSSFSYAANCFDCRSSQRKSYRRKSRSKAKVESKRGEKVFPEELLGDTSKERQLSTFKSPKGKSHNKTPSSTDIVPYDFSPVVRPSHSCTELENFCDANGHNNEQIPECSSSETSDVCGCCVCRNVYSCKPGPIPKCELHNPKGSSGKKSQHNRRTVNSNNDHRPVPKSRGTADNNVKKKRNNLSTTQRKDQSRLTWKRYQRDRSIESRRETMSLPDHAHFDSISQTSSIPSQQEAFSCDELAVMPNYLPKQNKAANVSKSPDADDMPCKEICVDTSVECSPQVVKGVRNRQHSFFCKKPIEMIHVVEMIKSDGYQSNSAKSKKSNGRTMRGPWSKSYKCHHEPFQAQQQFQANGKFFEKDRSTYDPLHPWLKVPRMKSDEEKHLQRFMNRDWSDAFCFESNITTRPRRGQDVTQQQNSRKWIPVCKKNTSIPKASVSAVMGENNNDNSPLENTDICSAGDVNYVSVLDAPSDLTSPNLLLNDDTSSVMTPVPEAGFTDLMAECPKVQSTKKYTLPIHVPDDLLHHFISGQSVEQAIVSSYKLQLASEGVHQATGYLLAEFERLLWSATPNVACSVLPKTYDSSFSDLLKIPILCTEQTPNISLHSIWDWYEEPGNYGLKVNVDQHLSLEGCVADTASFHAHFVPLLSAIQLFGYNCQSSSCGKSQELKLEAHGLEDNIQTPLFANPSISSALEAANIRDCPSQMFNSMGSNSLLDIGLHDLHKPLNSAAPSLLSDAEILFEFFESEQPQRRKPLHNKIMELASEGISNNQVFGDPSKLVSTNLNDLHPASWFSVAWYPIYRIPEGKMRAAFLTYHSLGYLAQRCTTDSFPDMSPLSFALPVIGLEGYNAQGELWFSPNMEHESSLGALTSSVLKERLWILEENALFFASGLVSKDHKTVTNRQPDYEFFMTRKGKPPCP